jgi:hypothetical protein
MKNLKITILESQNNKHLQEAKEELDDMGKSSARQFARKLPELIDLLEECYLAGSGSNNQMKQHFDISIYQDFEVLKVKMQKSLKALHKAGF